MKKLIILAFPLLLFAQGTGPQTGNITRSATTCLSNACVYYQPPTSVGTVTLTILVPSAFSGTIQFEAGGTSDSSGPKDPSNSAISCTLTSDGVTTATSATGAGEWRCPVAGQTQIQARASSYSSGTAVVTIQGSLASSGGAGFGGGSAVVCGATKSGTMDITSTIGSPQDCPTALVGNIGLGQGVTTFNASITSVDPATQASETIPLDATMDIRRTFSGVAPSDARWIGNNFFLNVNPSTSVDDHSAQYCGLCSTVEITKTGVVTASADGGLFVALIPSGLSGSANPIFGSRSIAMMLSGGDGAIGSMSDAFSNGATAVQGLNYSSTVPSGIIGSAGRSWINSPNAGQPADSVGLVGYLHVGASGRGQNVFGTISEVGGTSGNFQNAYGLYVKAVSGAANLNVALYTESGAVQFTGPTTPAGGLTGNLALSALATPTINTVAAQTPTGGITYTYKVVACFDANTSCTFHTAASAAVSTTNAPNDLTAGNGVKVQWSAVIGAAGGYKVYRTAAGGSTTNTTGFIANVAQNMTFDAFNVTLPPAYLDVGLAGDSSSPPSTNTTGVTNSPAFATPTNCSSAGGTCGSAAAGAFTMAAAATTATVSTTAVNANSTILITENSTFGTRLSVTCNTTAVRTYLISTVTAGTSFVVTSSVAPSVNPACLSYFIVN